MTPTPTQLSKLAGKPQNKAGWTEANLTPAAPAIHLCPKCGQAMRQYSRSNGQKMLQCIDRKGCNLRLPFTEAPAPDLGLTSLKALPGALSDGLGGLKTPDKTRELLLTSKSIATHKRINDHA